MEKKKQDLQRMCQKHDISVLRGMCVIFLWYWIFVWSGMWWSGVKVVLEWSGAKQAQTLTQTFLPDLQTPPPHLLHDESNRHVAVS